MAVDRLAFAWAGRAAAALRDAFLEYYVESREIPRLAQQAFEARDPARSLRLSRRRLTIYSESLRAVAQKLARAVPDLLTAEAGWSALEARYRPLVAGRYEADLAMAYLHSVRRHLYQDEWRPVAYAFETPAFAATRIYRAFPGGPALTAETVEAILAIPAFQAPFQDLAGDAALVARRVNESFGLDGQGRRGIRTIRMIDAGFFRNRGAYLVGRMDLADGGWRPFVLALDNDAKGIFVDAVLTAEDDCHNIFSSTLANFHVTDPHYHELAAFLHGIMPQRPLGLHYSTIGFNHVGKVAVMDELRRERAARDEAFDTAPGFRGTVAIGFTMPGSAYVLKVIRDKPTAQYKWGRFDGVESVLAKYRRVHEINRTGSMLDNIIYTNIKLEADWFAPALREELLAFAGGTVSPRDGALVFKHLIVQPKMTPLPLFLAEASPEEAERAMVNLGHCIRNNAAADIFNKDLDARNYGVSSYLKVYLFDYDAIEPLTAVKIRSNAGRFDGEEEIPDWVFEEGYVFLPEEIIAGLGIGQRELVRLFRRRHGELFTLDYWEGVQKALQQGRVPRLRVYREATRLRERQVDYSRA